MTIVTEGKDDRVKKTYIVGGGGGWSFENDPDEADLVTTSGACCAVEELEGATVKRYKRSRKIKSAATWWTPKGTGVAASRPIIASTTRH